MKINRRYKRSIKRNLSFYVSSTILTVVALMLYLALSIGGRGIITFANNFFETQKVEDAEFNTYLPISNSQVNRMQENFDLTLERQEYFNFEEDLYTARVFSKNKLLNLYDITKGQDVVEDDEVIISQGFAENRQVNIGDYLEINEKNYKVTGFFERPDYLYMLKETADSTKNDSTFFLAYVSEDEFKGFGEPACNYAVRYNQDNSIEFREYLDNKFKIIGYLTKEENSRIDNLYTQPQIFITMSYFMLIFIPGVVVALISAIIGRMVKKEQKLIGTLIALGYRKRTLIQHYMGFAAIPGVVGSILAIILVSSQAQNFGKMCLSDYEPIKVAFSIQPYEIILCIIVPTIMYMFSTMLSVNKLLKSSIVLLLSGNAEGRKKKKSKLLVDSKLHFRKKFIIRSILFNKTRSFVIFLGIFLGGFIIMFATSFLDSLKAISEQGSTSIGSFQYEYVVNEMLHEERDDAESVILTSFERLNGSSFYLMGIDNNNPYIELKDDVGNKLSLDNNGAVITSLAAKIYDINIGDTFEFRNGNTLEIYDVVITGIAKNSFQKCLYLSKDDARELLDWKYNWYNALQSDEELDIDKDDVNLTVTKESIRQQMKTMINQMTSIVYILVFLGVIICISSIYVTVNMLVDENKVNISMLKVLGYRNKEIDKMILKVNNVLLVAGIVLSIPMAYLVDYGYFQTMADSLGAILPVIYNPISIGITISFVVACYSLSLTLLKRKAYRINAVESMKDNRE